MSADRLIHFVKKNNSNRRKIIPNSKDKKVSISKKTSLQSCFECAIVWITFLVAFFIFMFIYKESIQKTAANILNEKFHLNSNILRSPIQEIKSETVFNNFKNKKEKSLKPMFIIMRENNMINSTVKNSKQNTLNPEDIRPILMEKNLRFIKGRKVGVRRDVRVIIPDFDKALSNIKGTASGVVNFPRAYTDAKSKLEKLSIFSYLGSSEGNRSLEDTMHFLQNQDACYQKPVFLSMASVGDELYWQLIENFVYTMLRFDLISCSLVICVSDPHCIQLCRESNFPCFDFQSSIRPLPSIMEQIAEVKLYYIPKALERKVDVFMLDLDVGFIHNPIVLVKSFYATPKVDIFVQEDLIFIMNRSKAGWKTWFTEPLPNIGLFLVRGNNITVKVFSIAWAKYQKDGKAQKMNPGKDQNHVLEGMRVCRVKHGLRFAYFSDATAVLLDKMSLNKNWSVELGGEAATQLLEEPSDPPHSRSPAVAVHTTCYEHRAKALGLKAANAFWHPRYYDPLRATLTKQIVFISERQVLTELRALLWLAAESGRAAIVPNVLGGPNQAGAAARFHGRQHMWPGFRVGRHGDLKVKVLEPAFYWRVGRDYDEPPPPLLLRFTASESLQEIRNRLMETTAPRVVLSPLSAAAADLLDWAQDSVGVFRRAYEEELQLYSPLPPIDAAQATARQVLANTDLCAWGIFSRLRGNRSCFQICN